MATEVVTPLVDVNRRFLGNSPAVLYGILQRYRIHIVYGGITLLYIPIFLNISHYGFWRHDDIIYLPHYFQKLVQEGRWGNTLLFPLLRELPGWLHWYCAFFSIAWFLFFALRRALGVTHYAAVITAVLMASPALYSQLNWPSTTLPTALMLAFSTWLVDRVRYPILLPFLSIVLFGMYQWAIYLLPLLYLDRQFPSWRDAIAWWTRFILVWGISYVIGFCVVQSILRALTGSGIQLAFHRDPDFATDAGHLLANLFENAAVAITQMATLVPASPLLILFTIAAWLFFWRQSEPSQQRRALIILCVGFAIGFCHYVIAAPSGIRIDYRSAFPLFIGLVLIFFSIAFLYRQVLVLVLVASLVGLPAWYISWRSTAWFASVSQAMRRDVRANVSPEFKESRILVDARQHGEYYQHITAGLPPRFFTYFETLDDPHRWRRAMDEEGFHNVVTCPAYFTGPMTEECLDTVSRVTQAVCIAQRKTICVAERGTRVILRLQAP